MMHVGSHSSTLISFFRLHLLSEGSLAATKKLPQMPIFQMQMVLFSFLGTSHLPGWSLGQISTGIMTGILVAVLSISKVQSELQNVN